MRTNTHISLHLSVQRHHREGEGQALPPRLLYVRRLRHQPQTERLLLYRGQSLLWDPCQGTGPAPRGLRRCRSLPQLQGGDRLRWRRSWLCCNISGGGGLKAGRMVLLNILAYIYQVPVKLESCYWISFSFGWAIQDQHFHTDRHDKCCIEHTDTRRQNKAWIPKLRPIKLTLYAMFQPWQP